jgi:hypothetical protein
MLFQLQNCILFIFILNVIKFVYIFFFYFFILVSIKIDSFCIVKLFLIYFLNMLRSLF